MNRRTLCIGATALMILPAMGALAQNRPAAVSARFRTPQGPLVLRARQTGPGRFRVTMRQGEERRAFIVSGEPAQLQALAARLSRGPVRVASGPIVGQLGMTPIGDRARLTLTTGNQSYESTTSELGVIEGGVIVVAILVLGALGLVAIAGEDGTNLSGKIDVGADGVEGDLRVEASPTNRQDDEGDADDEGEGTGEGGGGNNGGGDTGGGTGD